MADIKQYPFVRHFRGAPTDHVVHLHRGKVAHTGTGQAFWFRPLTAALSLVPADDRELPLLFHAWTADYQDVTVQATVTYRFADPAAAAERIDFAIDPDRAAWRGTPLDQVAHLLTELAQQYALDLLAGMDLATVLVGGVAGVRARVAEGLTTDERLAATGITVVGVRVVAIRPEPDLEKALKTPARELVQQDADKATYERRAMAVERERAISENELQSQIELATRTEQLVAQQGANERRRSVEEAAAERIAVEARAEADRMRAAARAETLQVVGAAEAEAEGAKMAVYAELDPKVLLALAVRELGRQLPNIGTLNVTPDMLTAALAQLAAPKPTADHKEVR